MEEWKQYHNIKVSNKGNIINRNGINQGNKHTHGYRQCNVNENGVHKRKYVHRIVAETFIPNPHKLPVVNHIDGNKENNDVNNLEWVSLKENSQHAFRTGLANNDFLKEINSKSCKVFDKRVSKWYTFNSGIEASQFFGHNDAYMSHVANRHKGENKKYLVEIGG